MFKTYLILILALSTINSQFKLNEEVKEDMGSENLVEEMKTQIKDDIMEERQRIMDKFITDTTNEI